MKTCYCKRSILVGLAVILFIALVLTSSCGEEKKVSFSEVKIEGSIGTEPKITIPKDFNPTDEAFGLLREGTGEPITDKNEVVLKIQKIGTHDPKKIYSTWSDSSADITIDLQESYKGQVQADLRNLLLKSKVGAVLIYATTESMNELTDGKDKSSKKVKQVWIISIVEKRKATIVTEDPNAASTESAVNSKDK